MIDLSICVVFNVGAYFVRIMMCWYVFYKFCCLFVFGCVIVSDYRLVGVRI